MITIVSGLPRSGTSMAMQILTAGGLSPLTDELRQADVSNPKGYYEFELVKQLPQGNVGWLSQAEGKVVKIVSPLLTYLPGGYSYQVIFMLRDLSEILRSQAKMISLQPNQPQRQVSDEEMSRLFTNHLSTVKNWLAAQGNFSTLYVSYNDLLSHPETGIESINAFLGGQLDAQKMLAGIDPRLYSQRA